MNVKVDPRGPRFGAVITTTVLALVLLTAPSTFVRPKLSPPLELEDSAPLRFAQLVGFIFAAVALVASLGSAETVALVATGFALGAAFLNAAFNICLGCEMYLLGKRLTAK